MGIPNNKKKFLLTLGKHKELILMDKSDSSEKYGEVQREFAKKAGKEKEWTSVSMLSLYDNQIIDGINYLEDYTSGGVHFTLIHPDNIDDKILEDVKEHLRGTRDALSFKVVTYPQGLVEIHSVELSEIKPLKGTGPDAFADFVAMLERPYFPISKDELDKVMELSKEQDFILYDNRVMTFGSADGGYALMPLQDKYAAEILKDNNMVSVSGKAISLQIGSEKKEASNNYIDPKNARYIMFMEAAQQVAGVYGISVEQYFDITLNTNCIDFKNDVKFSQIHDWAEADEFARKFVNDGKMPICKEVVKMSDDEIKAGMDEIATKDTNRSLDLN